jgi:hypothetical protein
VADQSRDVHPVSIAAGWFPVQAGIAGWMGDTRLIARDRARVSPKLATTEVANS